MSCETTRCHFVYGSVYRINHLKYFDSSFILLTARACVSLRNSPDQQAAIIGEFSKTHPREPDASDGITQHVPQDRRERVPGGEVGVKSGMLPVRHPRHDLRVHILHDLVPFLRFLWGFFGQQLPEVSRLDVRRHPLRTDVLQVITDIIDHLFAATPELFDLHFCANTSKQSERGRVSFGNNLRRSFIIIYSVGPASPHFC